MSTFDKSVVNRVVWLLLSSFVSIPLQSVMGFVIVATPRSSQQQKPSLIRYVKPSKENFDETLADEKEGIIMSAEELFPEAEIKEVVLLPHRPLGLTVEESLADSNHVLVTRIVEGGYADEAGIKVGDVLVGMTGLFGELTPVIGLGVDKIKGMVASRPEAEALQIKVARGTNVRDEHEKSVIEFCSQEADDKEIDQCVTDYLSMDYVDLNALQKTNDEECDPDSADADCLVDNLYNMWAEDLPPEFPQEPSPLDDSEKPKDTVKPWSSRSSPSGTYVRDPVTGKMKNIDA